MAGRPVSPSYFADTEGSNSEPSEMDPPHWKRKSSQKPGKSRHAFVRTQSEEDLFERGHSFDQTRRPSTPHYSKRHSSQREAKKPAQNSKCDKALPVAAPPPAAPLGTQVYNNPAGSFGSAGVNHIFVHHTTTNPSSFSTHTPQYNAVNLPGQPTTIYFKMPEQLGPYQNAGPPNNGLNFQPQTPDTSLGPIYHHYIPRADGHPGTYAYMIAPGIIPQGAAGPLQAGITTNPMMPMPVINHQPYPGQPMFMGGGNMSSGQPMMMPMAGGAGGGVPPGQPVLVNGGPAPMMPGAFPAMNNMAAPFHFDPAAGMTNPELNEPQDFKPADDSPSRMYWVRQLDGEYCQMPRITIDSFGQAARWYCTDEGVFYAVRLAD
ncbi:hypothetical protein N0V82_004574 [Gnomoniopsis sp. IMI 355080]|nr:hypothetical protein N0V82_004574 [Gnomoniopsis sp. IMI 355080]